MTDNNVKTPSGIDFLLLPGMHLLDLAGPAQVFSHVAVGCPLRTIGPVATLTAAQGLPLGTVEALPTEVEADRWLLVIGSTGMPALLDSPVGRETVIWLQSHAHQWTRVGSVCAGALVLGAAGLLDGRHATTHHALLNELKQRAPDTHVVDDTLFVDDGERCTSAGLSSATDLALHLVARHWGEQTAETVARDLMIYRRAVNSAQVLSFTHQHRHHPDQRIHGAQDAIANDLSVPGGVQSLAAAVHLSERQFRRRFHAATGLSVRRYVQRARLDHSEQLLRETDQSIESVAADCGLDDVRSLQRLWQSERGCSPSAVRRSSRSV